MESRSALHRRARTSPGESPEGPEELTRLFEAAIDEADDVFLVLDGSGELVVWNARTVAATGYPDEELAGVDPAELFVGDGYARLVDAIQGTRTDGTGFVQADLRTKDGASVPKEFTLSRIEAEGSEKFVAIGRNLDKASRYQHRYYQLLDRITEGFLALDSAWRFTYLNRKAREFYGETDEDPVGKAIWDVFPDIVGTEHETHLRRAAEEQTVQRYESYYEPHDRWYDIRIYPDRDGVSSLVTDVTKRHEYERRLERQNERLERFASVVSHDLRSPLRVAQGRVELAREECDSEHLVGIEDAHGRIEHLVEDLLVLARQGEAIGERAPVGLAEIVRACATTVGIDRDRLVIDTERTVRADESRLRQLLENLLRNSREHGGEGVTVTVEDTENGFFVEDDGPGIPPEDRDRVFDAGYSTTPEGTGIGLSIVGEVAEAHGWSVTAAEGCEGGARFEIVTE